MSLLPQHLLAGIVLASGVGALVMCLLVLRYGFTGPDDTGDWRRRQVLTRLGHAVAGTCFAAAAILAVVLVARAQPGPAERRPGALVDGDDVAGVMDARVAGVVERLAALESRVEAVESHIAPLDGHVADTRDRLDALAAGLDRAALDHRVQEIAARLGPLERRLEGAEPARGTAGARLDRAEARMSAVESLVRQHTDDLVRVAARLRQVEGRQATVPAGQAPAGPRRGAGAPPAPASPRAATAPTPRAATPPPRRESSPPPLGDRIRDDWETVRRGFADAGEDFKRAVDSLRRNLRETLDR